MFDIFMYAANAVLPIILLILAGWFFRKIKLLDTEVMTRGNNFIYKALLPLLIFYNIYNVESIHVIRLDIILFSALSMLFLFGLGLIFCKTCIKRKTARGIILHSAFFSNFLVIGLGLTEALGGASGTTTASLMSVVVVPLSNILGILSFNIFRGEGVEKKRPLQVLRAVILSPMTLGALIGIAALLIRAIIPLNAAGDPVFTIRTSLPFLYKAIGNASQITSPLAIIFLGGLLNFGSVRGNLGLIITSVVSRTVVSPIIGLTIAVICHKVLHIIEFDAACYASLIALFGAPGAVMSPVIAEQMGGDAELGRHYIVWTSLSILVTMFATIILFRSVGLL